MARVKIDGNLILSYDIEPFRSKYWGGLSEKIISNYGRQKFTEHDQVENILLDSFKYLTGEFRALLRSEDEFTFYSYVFLLHEESLELLIKIRGGLNNSDIDENYLSGYRRVLKLILEQGCDHNLTWGKFPKGADVYRLDEKIQALIYLGTWMYTFADYIAFHKMIQNGKYIDFSEEGFIEVDWQKHYGQAYKQLFPTMMKDYEKATFDEDSLSELKLKINDCFGVDYDLAGGIIFEIKRHFSDGVIQTIEPYVLPMNLVKMVGIDRSIAQSFYDGLSLSKENKLTIEDAIQKPYSTERYLFRPILIYQIEGVDRALVTENKFAESMYVLATNVISWNTLPIEWKEIKCMFKYMCKKGNEHDSILENAIEKTLIKHKFRFCRNIKSFKRKGQNNLRIDNELAGEIDFIVVSDQTKKIYVADSKYNKAKYEGVGFRSDHRKFLSDYEPQLAKKVKWISENKQILQEHLEIYYDLTDLEIVSYEVEGLFFLNTPTFYMFSGSYKAVTLNQFENFITGEFLLPALEVKSTEGTSIKINHPYFK